MKIKILSTLVFTLVLSVAAVAQTDFDKAKLDQFFDALAAKNKAMGSVAISKYGSIIYSRAIGYSQINDKKPATAQTKYRIGSITKMFTAVMVFQLAEQGKLKLTDTIDEYFPEMPNAKRITVANLLNHRSGLHSFTDDADYLTYNQKPQTRKQMLERMQKAKPDFEPNAKAEYSNTNYILLGWIVERASGKTYQEFLREKIASKINLPNTYVGGKIDVKANESFSYDLADGVWKFSPETDMSIPGGAGALVSTPTDLTRFITALFDGKLISQASLNQMKTITDEYGMGIFQYPVYGKKGFGHSGGIDGFNSMLVYLPDEKLAVAYTSNGRSFPINDIMIAAFAAALNQPFTVPSFEVFAVKSEDLDKYLGNYSSADLPSKLTITKKGATLYAQATGQQAFPLEATAKDKFKFDPISVVIVFDAEKNQLTIKQGGGSYLYTKDK